MGADFTPKDAAALREYFEVKLLASEKAAEVAAATLKERLTSMNEFRDQLREQAAGFLTRAEFAAQHQRAVDDLAELKRFRDHQEGMASQKSVNVALLFSAVSMVLAVISTLIVVLKFIGG